MVNLFLVYESMKSILLGLPPAEALSKSRHGKVRYHEIIGLAHLEDESQLNIFKRKVRESHFNKIPIKNCFLCRYHVDGEMEDAVFYKFRKENVSSNEAVVCKYYRAFSSMKEYHEADRVNDEYTKKNELWVSDGVSIPIRKLRKLDTAVKHMTPSRKFE